MKVFSCSSKRKRTFPVNPVKLDLWQEFRRVFEAESAGHFPKLKNALQLRNNFSSLAFNRQTLYCCFLLNKGALPHLVYACVFRINYVSSYMSVETIISSTKMQSNAENECVNRMWQHAFSNSCTSSIKIPLRDKRDQRETDKIYKNKDVKDGERKRETLYL